MSEMGRLMGLDVGDVRIGVALSDPLQMISSPHSVVQEKSREAAVNAIKKIVEEQEVIRIVAGVPLNEAGGHGIQADKTLAFIEILRAAVNVEVVVQDERFTTAAAERMLIGANMRRDKRKQNVDKIAAAHILQAYLEKVAAQRRFGGKP
jgi:putative holliday junction resolvase